MQACSTNTGQATVNCSGARRVNQTHLAMIKPMEWTKSLLLYRISVLFCAFWDTSRYIDAHACKWENFGPDFYLFAPALDQTWINRVAEDALEFLCALETKPLSSQRTMKYSHKLEILYLFHSTQAYYWTVFSVCVCLILFLCVVSLLSLLCEWN